MGTFLLWPLFSTGHFSPLAAFLHCGGMKVSRILTHGRAPVLQEQGVPGKIADYITKVTAMMQQQEAKIQLSCAGVDNPWTTAQEGFY